MRVRFLALQLKCQVKERTIALAQASYAGDTGGPYASIQSAADGDRELLAALEKGRLFAYIGNLEAYKSPLEPNSDRLRSYSLNRSFRRESHSN